MYEVWDDKARAAYSHTCFLQVGGKYGNTLTEQEAIALGLVKAPVVSEGVQEEEAPVVSEDKPKQQKKAKQQPK